MTEHVTRFMDAVKVVAHAFSPSAIEDMADELVHLRENEGSLYIIGVGGSAANASHAVNDFRKICGIDAKAPTDNVSELTARTNDEGWATVFSASLAVSGLCSRDAILVLSVGGGDLEKNISPCIVEAVRSANAVGAKVLGIVGRDGGYTTRHGDCVILVPKWADDLVTPITESFQSVLLHALVSHPKLAVRKAKWESAV